MPDRSFPTLLLGMLFALPVAVAPVPVAVRPATADVTLEVVETSWSAARQPARLESRIRTRVGEGRRRVESVLSEAFPDSLRRRSAFVQIDRLDSDSTYYLRPGERAYFALPLARARATNRRLLSDLWAARRSGAAPADTLPPVTVRELGRSRTIAGIACRGVVVDLTFAYRDSAVGPDRELTGVLSDTVWLAPPDSPPGALRRFERAFARATAADSFLAAATPAELAAARGQGLVSVVQRAVQELPGVPLASHFVNLLIGLPRGMSGVERRADGAVVVQRTVRETVAVDPGPVADGAFEVPDGMKRVAPGGGP